MSESSDIVQAVIDVEDERLKRAAPDLLAALRSILAKLKDSSNGLLMKNSCETTIKELATIAREAIAKIENL